MLINQEQQMLLLQACTVDDREAIVIPPLTMEHFEMSGHFLLRRIRRLTGWTDNNPRVVYGSFIPTHCATDDTFKMVVFTSHKATLDAFDELFRQRYDSQDIYATVFGSGMSREDLEESVYLFQNDPNCRAIICDETGGEGRNFQSARLVLHLDLPWSANALEQRIGRLNRLGRDADKDVLSVILYAQGTVEEQLFLIWRDGLKLFEESLSGLEIITGELNQLIVEALTDDYYFGLKNAFEDILDQAEEMREAVEDEKDFDLGATLYSPMVDGVDRTLALYEHEDGNLFAGAMMSWAAQAGLHGRRGREEGLIEFMDSSFSVKAARQSILVPPDWTTYDDSFLMKREGKGCCLFRITNATCRPRLALSRAYRSQATTWQSFSMPPTWANVAAHAGFAYLSFRWRRCSSPSARISRICPTTLSPFFSAISRTAFRDSR